MNQIKDFIEYILRAVKIWVIVQKWESGIRVRLGKHIKRLSPGIHFKLPYFDSVYVLENRLRVSQLSMQTLTSSDDKTITIDSAIGYEISDVEKLFNTLHEPELTIGNIAKAASAEYVSNTALYDITPDKIEKHVLQFLEKENYGLRYKYFKITNFAVVKTFRLIQDQSWSQNSLNLNTKK